MITITIEINNLNYSYPKAKEPTLKDVSLTLGNNKINVVLGLNGAGKTTLFDLISGVLPKTNKIIGNENSDVLYQVQGVPLLSSLKGKEITSLILKSDHKYRKRILTYDILLTENSDQNEIEKAQKIWDMKLGKMSPGEKRWLIISSYCKIEREIYIFDEPTSGVDPNSKFYILNQIKSLSREANKIVVLSTHNLHDLQQIQGNIFLLHEGKIVFKGDYDSFLTKGESVDPNICFKNLTHKRKEAL